ncbi:hypothetical protein RF11_13551 [Thelohanellus kitauei]|uniref:Uncharacterized protein n=1 Tax=Thelohanellus kitauei TaxID=669202 RepID=A0A0C2JHZ2_THEKT|nr:hypothetical protein RF11_13551 [Thelohanellus kitauei]
MQDLKSNILKCMFQFSSNFDDFVISATYQFCCMEWDYLRHADTLLSFHGIYLKISQHKCDHMRASLIDCLNGDLKLALIAYFEDKQAHLNSARSGPAASFSRLGKRSRGTDLQWSVSEKQPRLDEASTSSWLQSDFEMTVEPMESQSDDQPSVPQPSPYKTYKPSEDNDYHDMLN